MSEADSWKTSTTGRDLVVPSEGSVKVASSMIPLKRWTIWDWLTNSLPLEGVSQGEFFRVGKWKTYPKLKYSGQPLTKRELLAHEFSLTRMWRASMSSNQFSPPLPGAIPRVSAASSMAMPISVMTC